MRPFLLVLVLLPLSALAQPGWDVPPDAPSISLDFADSVLLGASVDAGAVRPSVQARIPVLGSSATDATVSVGLDVALR